MDASVKGYEIPQALAQQIINYLAQRPFAEVEPLINGMRQMREVDIQVAMPGLQAVPDATDGDDAPKPNGDGEHIDA